MPNHVANIVKMKGIRNLPLFSEDDNSFDFNKLIPMPESLDIESGSVEDIAIETVLRELSKGKMFGRNYKTMSDEEYQSKAQYYKDCKEELLGLGFQYIQNKIKYGHTTWYDWCCENWGTKWNAYSCEILDDDTIKFETAWSNPEPILHKLSEMYPGVEVQHWWADEDCGRNTGYRCFEDGEIMCGDYDDPDSSEAYEHYNFCWGESPCIYQDEEGNYCKHDCETCHGCD